MATLHPHPASRPLGRRTVLRGVAQAGLLATAAPLLDLLPTPALAAAHRGFVGCVKTRPRSYSLAEMIKLLPEGIGVAATYLNLSKGTREELANTYATYEKNIAYLAKARCDTISIEGAPPFLLLGPEREAKLVDEWKAKYKTDMFTSSQSQVSVMRALKIGKILGITAFGEDLNRSYAKYFEDAGIHVVAMEGMNISFKSIPDAPEAAISAFIRKTFAEHKGAEGVYILGSALEALDLIAPLERDLGVPIVQPVAARVWDILRRLKIHEPIKGYGRLLETLPA